MDMDMKKILTLSSPPLPRSVLDKLIGVVIQDEGNERALEWSVNEEDGTLDLDQEECYNNKSEPVRTNKQQNKQTTKSSEPYYIEQTKQTHAPGSYT